MTGVSCGVHRGGYVGYEEDSPLSKTLNCWAGTAREFRFESYEVTFFLFFIFLIFFKASIGINVFHCGRWT